jgi:YVTN family beta-propeller protein
MIFCLRLVAVLSLIPFLLIPYGLPPEQQLVFATSFTDPSGDAIITSNEKCQPDSLVHCIGEQPQQQKGSTIENAAATLTTSFESFDGVIDQTQNISAESTPEGFLYMANAKSNSVAVIDLATNAIVNNVTLGRSPHDIKISDDQQMVYTTDIDSGTVSIIDTTSNTLIDQIEIGGNRTVHGIAIFNDTMYVGDVYSGKVLVIRNDGQIVNEIQVGAGPEYVEASPNGKFLYVANLWSPISVVDIAQNKVIREIDSGETPHGLSFTDDGSLLFIVNMNSNTLSIIDATKHELIKTIPVGNKPEYVALTPDQRFAFVTNLGSDTVSIVDTRTLSVVKEVPLGGDGPHGIAFSADGDMAYVSNMNSSDISVIDVTTGQEIARFPSGGAEPHQIVLKKPFVGIVASAQIEDDNNNNDNINVTTTTTTTTTTTSIPMAEVYVDIANDRLELARGLMFQENLESNNGMLFVYDDEDTRNFTMKNTLITLDMLFIDSNLTIVDIKENVPPCIEINDRCPSYVSKEPAKFVLEVNAGFVKNNRVSLGDRLILNDNG